MKYSDKLLSAFLVNLSPNRPSNDCWPWLGKINDKNKRYGVLHINSKTYKAHRLSYFLFNGDIPDGLLIRHTCDNPICVNPKHLLAGTDKDNILDSLKRDRFSSAKLTNIEVAVIRFKLKYQNYHGLASKLARDYNVGRSVISSIKNNNIWKHIQV